MWAGFGSQTPSVLAVDWSGPDGQQGRFALGLGDTFNGKRALYSQPAEVWWSRPVGRLTLKAGRYWTPFAAQEWHYELRYGAMVSRQGNHGSASLSFHPSSEHRGAAIFARAGRSLGGGDEIGLSLGAGRGLSYGSSHDRAAGLDWRVSRGAWCLTGEYVWLGRPGSGDFRFLYTRLSHDGPGRCTPFVAYYDWRDRAGEQGRFQSLAPGVKYRVNEVLSVEAAWAATSRRRVGWLQFCFCWE
jgi:hypothetical protein